jgi:hypothetical protein
MMFFNKRGRRRGMHEAERRLDLRIRGRRARRSGQLPSHSGAKLGFICIRFIRCERFTLFNGYYVLIDRCKGSMATVSQNQETTYT